MNKKKLFLIMMIFGGADCLGNGLHYFISGESYNNTTLRNYAVIGQIVFALAIFAYCIWYHKTSIEKTER